MIIASRSANKRKIMSFLAFLVSFGGNCIFLERLLFVLLGFKYGLLDSDSSVSVYMF
jgi:hypothetical protein